MGVNRFRNEKVTQSFWLFSGKKQAKMQHQENLCTALRSTLPTPPSSVWNSPVVALAAFRAERAGAAVSESIKRRLQGTTRSMRHWGTIPGGQIFRLKAISSSQLIANTRTMGSCHLSFSSDSIISIPVVKGPCAFPIYGYGHRSPEEMQALGRTDFLGWDSPNDKSFTQDWLTSPRTFVSWEE